MRRHDDFGGRRHGADELGRRVVKAAASNMKRAPCALRMMSQVRRSTASSSTIPARQPRFRICREARPPSHSFCSQPRAQIRRAEHNDALLQEPLKQNSGQELSPAPALGDSRKRRHSSMSARPAECAASRATLPALPHDARSNLRAEYLRPLFVPRERFVTPRLPGAPCGFLNRHRPSQ
jgi:hypothetical protein